MAARAAVTRAAQHPDARAEVLQDVGQRQRAHAGGGDLDGEREAVEPAAQLAHHRQLIVRHGHPGMAGTVAEQLDGTGRHVVGAGGGYLEGAEGHHRLAGQIEG